ncbi:purine/pyrimidine permease [Paenibacillus senegalensis]|uniref:purine/pyrimidine permease n=1 Tax=Paenibacillus senegalensis TaxID=1465766 RepID=UPI00028A3E52|nr:purine/pyrimidine permease [Paenibacillus senegalensis]
MGNPSSLSYKLNDKPRGTVLFFSSLQWFVFMLANFVTVPVVLGQALGLAEAELALFVSRTLFLCGGIGALQVLFGHRLPILEGPAGMWWGVFVVLIGLHMQTGLPAQSLMLELQMGLLVCSAVFILLALFRLLPKVLHWFTPAVTGTFLVLLAFQLSPSLVQGVLGIGYRGSEQVIPLVMSISGLLIGLTVGLMLKGRGLIKNLAVLISIGAGWLIYAALGLVDLPDSRNTDWVAWPSWLPYGLPQWNTGVVLTCLITAGILLSNLVASIKVTAEASEEKTDMSTYSRGSLITGVGTFMSGLLGTVGAVPLTAAASLISLTGIASRLPFLLASAAFIVLGMFPKLGLLLSSIPQPVAYAVLFAVFGQLLGFGLRDLKKLKLDQRDVFIVGLSLLAGAGVLFINGDAWSVFPPVVGYLAGNGLIIGVALAIILEHVIFRNRASLEETKGEENENE